LERLHPNVCDLIALLSGAAMPLAFAPFRLYPLAIILPAVLFALWLRASPARAAWRGWLFGVGMFGVGTSWVYVSLHTYGNMPVALAALTVAVFTAWLAVFPALTGWLQGLCPGPRAAPHLLLIAPSLWVLAEWARGWVLTGFPWLNLGYSQVPGPLAELAPWLGVYGVSWATAVAAALLVQGVRDRSRLWTRYMPALALLWIGGWLAGMVQWVQPAGEPLPVALVQGDIPLELKWRPQYQQQILERYAVLSERARDSRLIVWPEAAMPMYLDEVDPAYLARLRAQVRQDGGDFLVGVVERDRAHDKFYNSVVSIGSTPGIYRKRHLVPLGEFLPLKSVFGWLLRYLDIPMSDFSAGARDQPPLRAAGQVIGVSICYEDAFGQELIRELPAATLLVNVSEEAWFGHSLAPHQRLQMARMRALEAGRFMLRVANTGPSAVIDARGRVIARSPQFQPYVLTADVQPLTGATPYVRFGNYAIVSLLLVIALATEVVVIRRARNGRQTHPDGSQA
jgi:apolipoprotein N-acyltransferase